MRPRQVSQTYHPKPTVQRAQNKEKGTHSGCNVLIPCFSEIAPVIKGRTALPACPKPAIQPIELVRIQRGRMRPVWFMAMGYMGPSRMPTMDMATALPIKEGTNQMVRSRLSAEENQAAANI